MSPFGERAGGWITLNLLDNFDFIFTSGVA